MALPIQPMGSSTRMILPLLEVLYRSTGWRASSPATTSNKSLIVWRNHLGLWIIGAGARSGVRVTRPAELLMPSRTATAWVWAATSQHTSTGRH